MIATHVRRCARHGGYFCSYDMAWARANGTSPKVITGDGRSSWPTPDWEDVATIRASCRAAGLWLGKVVWTGDDWTVCCIPYDAPTWPPLDSHRIPAWHAMYEGEDLDDLVLAILTNRLARTTA